MKINDAKTRNVTEVQPQNDVVLKRVSVFSDPNKTEISYIDISKLHPYKKQARRIFNEADIDSLAETIKEHGIRQPLTVLRSEGDIVSFEVVSGERRFRAAKKLLLKKLPCIIIDDADKAEEIALIENVQRNDLHPIELARSLKRMADYRGWGGQKELSQKIGISNSQLSELLKINTLEDDVLDFALDSNFRGRDNFRKLYLLTKKEEQFSFIGSFVPDKSVSSGAVKNKKRKTSESVLRVSFFDDTLKVQKSKLKTLTNEQKAQLKDVLISVLDDLSK